MRDETHSKIEEILFSTPKYILNKWMGDGELVLFRVKLLYFLLNIFLNENQFDFT